MKFEEHGRKLMSVRYFVGKENVVNIADIIEAIQANRINITSHARKEAKEDALMLSDITYSTCHGEIMGL